MFVKNSISATTIVIVKTGIKRKNCSLSKSERVSRVIRDAHLSEIPVRALKDLMAPVQLPKNQVSTKEPSFLFRTTFRI